MENEFRDNFNQLVRFKLEYNTALRRRGKEPCFYFTDNALKALIDLTIPNSEEKFGSFIMKLEQLTYESSRSGKSLPNNSDLVETIDEIRQLRHEYGHDRLIGNERNIQKKQMKIGSILQKYANKIYPKNEDFLILSINLLKNLNKNMEQIIENIDTEEDEFRREFQNVIYNIKKRKKETHRTLHKKGEFEHLSVTPIFVPNMFWPPEIRSEKECVYIPIDINLKDDSIKGVKKFLKIIERYFEKDLSRYIYLRKLFPWSISNTQGIMAYGVGISDLFHNLKNLERSVLTIVLTGEYGKEMTSFLMVVGMDFRNNYASYCFIDFYLSNIPLENQWIVSLKHNLDGVTNAIDGGESCCFYSTAFKRWEVRDEDFSISNLKSLVGKIESDRFSYYDYGVIKIKNIVNWEVLDSWGDNYFKNCPSEYLDEYIGLLIPSLSEDEVINENIHKIPRLLVSIFNIQGRGGIIPIITGQITMR